MKKIVSVLFVIVMTVWLMGGCAEKEPLKNESIPLSEMDSSEQRQIEAYFPVNVGMVYIFAGEGNEYASFTREVKYVDLPYAQIHDNSGGTIVATVYKIQDDQLVRIFSQEEFYSDTNLLPNIEEKHKKEEVILKAPLKEGTTWESDEWKREIVAVDQTFKVPAGTFFRVIKVKTTFQDEQTEMYDYYAENIGLIAREYKSKDFEVTSRLERYGLMNEVATQSQVNDEESVIGVSAFLPDLSLLAYQLEHQLRSAFQAAFESYVNLDKLANYNDQNFLQILSSYKASIEPLAVESLVKQHVERLHQYYEVGEKVAIFPNYEVIKQTKLLNQTAQSATVSITLHKFYSAQEATGKAYDRVVDYLVELSKATGHWKVEKVRGVE